MKNYDIVIIGGSAAGLAALRSCARLYPDKSKALIKLDPRTLIPCAIPYVYGELGESAKDLIPNVLIEKCSADMIIGNVVSIDKDNHKLKFENGDEINYGKLVVSTGSTPVVPKINGFDKEGVFYVKKDADVVNNLKDAITKSKNIVVIGGGYIGVEFAEQIKEMSPEKNATIIEGSDKCLSMTFDERYSLEIEDKLKYVGINIVTNKYVDELCGDSNVTSVKLNDGSYIDCDLVIVAIGAKSNVKLAEDSGFEIGKAGGIQVDRFMKVEEDVFGCGDCVENYSFFNHKVSNVKLASVACMEGRLVAENLYNNHFPNPGIIGVYVTKIHDKAYAGAGYTKKAALKDNLDVIEGYAKVVNRHPGSLAGANEIEISLLFNKKNKVLVGAQMSGPLEIGDSINILGVAIENKMTVYDLFFMQPATQPKISPSPVMYHIVEAAENALKNF
ncbi:MAG: FAD-dependent oxidoreductase [Candidatus Woesearchaeota archaeon]|jgi:NADH oxidase (H2O2-forming)|nr:FAD-dependent oxidoreductase [Candidatus Woesearchaeota archaeon]